MKTICHEGFVGIDVSKEWIDIVVNNNWFRIDQTKKDIDKAIKEKIKPQNPLLCIVENTGGYERLMVERLNAALLNVHVAHPSRVRTFAQAKGLLAKTDKLDAHILSAYGSFMGTNSITKPIDEEQLKSKDLQARYLQLKGMLHAELCRLGNCISDQVKKNIQRTINFFKKEIELIESEIEQMIQKNEALAASQKILLSMKGIGKKTARTILISLPEIGQLSRKKIAALVGVAPITKQSGKKIGYARTQHGRQQVRNTLYMAALVAARHNPVYSGFYSSLVARGKAPKVALVAIMRKMIVSLNAMIRDNVEWKCMRI